MSYLQTNNVSVVSFKDSLYKLPSVTAFDIVNWNSTVGISTINSAKLQSDDNKEHGKKFFKKFAVVISSFVGPSVIAPKLLKKFPQITKFVPKNIASIALPVTVGLGLASMVSVSLQAILDKKVTKEAFISDMKDALITSSISSGFSHFVSRSSKLLNSYKIIKNTNVFKTISN